MRKLLGLAIAAALSGSTALATDLNVWVVSDTGFDMVTVPPGATVNYEVRGVLSSDTDNEGLALFGFDLVFDGGALGQAVTPSSGPIASFVIPEGITNPAGFGGTANVPGREGDLVQIGGGQNTINNDIGNAPYPIAEAVVIGLGHTEIVLAAGSLTAPDVEGTYTLSLANLFANVIKQGETEDGTYWAVEEAGVGTIENLMIEVGCVIVSTDPPNCAIDARQPSKPDGTEPAGWNSIDLTFSDASCAAAVGPGDFSVSVHPAETPPTITDAIKDGATVTLVFDRLISTGKWTCVTYADTTTCLGSLPGDVSAADNTSAPADILYVIDCLNGVRTCEMWQCDVDRSDMCGPPDILRVIDLLNGAGVYDPWLNVSMEVTCPPG